MKIQSPLTWSIWHTQFKGSSAKLKGVVLLEFCSENQGSSVSCVSSYTPAYISTAITSSSRGHWKSLWWNDSALSYLQWQNVNTQSEMMINSWLSKFSLNASTQMKQNPLDYFKRIRSFLIMHPKMATFSFSSQVWNNSTW